MPQLATLLEKRSAFLGPNVPLFYQDPLHLVKGSGVHVTDAAGRSYLDAYNNVPHVGHCYPHVVEAITRQLGTLNTHTRYLHGLILDYVERLTEKMGPQLTAMIMVCTGSEANDIALRMAQAASGKRGIIATDATYHGNTEAVSQLNVMVPDLGVPRDHYSQGPCPRQLSPTWRRGGGAPHARAFASSIEAACQELVAQGHGVAGMIICPAFINEGFPDLPQGFMDPAIAVLRKYGGYLIADEVQAGFGRVGSHFWGHQRIGIAPDIVTMGKPMGNGHPVAGVATSLEIMSAFRTKMRYFNTFGGNPVSCAAAMAVLDVLESEDLQTRAYETGLYLREHLAKFGPRFGAIGDIRGTGLAIGVELVTDLATKTPDPALTLRIVNAMRQNGVLIGSNGRFGNILKIRPPMPFSQSDAQELLAVMDAAFSDCC